MLSAILRLVLALLRISGYELERTRVPDAADKRRLLAAIERACKAMPLSAALRVLGLSSSRYHAWVNANDACTLDDRPSCPRSKVQRLTFDEVQAIGDMVQSTQHRHMSVRGLALHAQRIGRVFAHPATWSKLIRERGWRRPRLRLYPAKPKVGLRTHAPNEAWHIRSTAGGDLRVPHFAGLHALQLLPLAGLALARRLRARPALATSLSSQAARLPAVWRPQNKRDATRTLRRA